MLVISTDGDQIREDSTQHLVSLPYWTKTKKRIFDVEISLHCGPTNSTKLVSFGNPINVTLIGDTDDNDRYSYNHSGKDFDERPAFDIVTSKKIMKDSVNAIGKGGEWCKCHNLTLERFKVKRITGEFDFVRESSTEPSNLKNATNSGELDANFLYQNYIWDSDFYTQTREPLFSLEGRSFYNDYDEGEKYLCMDGDWKCPCIEFHEVNCTCVKKFFDKTEGYLSLSFYILTLVLFLIFYMFLKIFVLKILKDKVNKIENVHYKKCVAISVVIGYSLSHVALISTLAFYLSSESYKDFMSTKWCGVSLSDCGFERVIQDNEEHNGLSSIHIPSYRIPSIDIEV